MVTIAPARILRPDDALTGVDSVGAYFALQRALMAKKRAAYPRMGWREPWESLEMVRPYVNWGRWLVPCPCGDRPGFHPEWRVALCLECGAIYRWFDVPDEETLALIERVLGLRPQRHQRNWTTETVDELTAENVTRGDPA